MTTGMLVFLVTAVLLPMLLAELGDWCPWLAKRLVRWSARRLRSPEDRARYEEEWVANLDEVPGKLSRLVAALGYLVSVPRMRATLGQSQSPQTTPLDAATGLPQGISNIWMLPRAPSTFVGREREVTHLLALTRSHLTDGNVASPVCVIQGMAGIGKTALAVHTAHLLASNFDNHIFVHLQDSSPDRKPLHAIDALGNILRCLGVSSHEIPPDLDRRAMLYRALVADTRTLILLDDATSEEQVHPLVPDSAGCLVVVTSRRKILELNSANCLLLTALPPGEAVELFCQIAGLKRIHGQRKTVVEIVALCGYLPLAIQLTAGRIRRRPDWRLSEVAEMLREGHRRENPHH